MSDQTPSLDEIRGCYKYSSREVHVSPGDAHFAFDRAIEKVRTEAKQEALREAAEALSYPGRPGDYANWLRARADKLVTE